MPIFLRFFLSLFLTILLLQPSCKNNPVDSIKDPRSYSWTIDTLAYPGSVQTLMYDIWGSSPQDVYAVGHNERAGGRMWHYNGSKWTPVKLVVSEGGPFTNIGTLSSIQGFGSNNIFVAGETVYENPSPPPLALDSSLVLWYNGTTWQQLVFERQRALQSTWGRNANDIWFGGLNGTLYHYDGTVMKTDSVPLLIPLDAEPFYNYYSVSGDQDGEAYLLLYAPYANEGGERYYIFSRQNNTWILTDSVFASYRKRLWMSPSGSLHAVGHGVYRKSGSSWNQFFGDELITFGIEGPNDNNLFTVGTEFRDGTYYGVIYHYNGSDWFRFNLNLPDVILYDVWTNGREVFGIGVTNSFPQVSVVAHGK